MLRLFFYIRLHHSCTDSFFNRLERIRKAKEAHAKAASGHSETEHADNSSAPGAMPPMGDFYKLLQDPEIMNALKVK